MPRLRTLTVVVVSAAMLALGLPALIAPPPAAAAQAAPVVRPAVPIVGERFVVSGRLMSPVARPVHLRHWTGDRWRTIATGQAGPRGYYSFSGIRTFRVRRYMVVAPPVRVNGRSYVRLATAARRVAPVGQSGHLVLMPPIVQPGTGVRNSRTARVPVYVRFRPARPGRTVRLERLSNGSWVGVARAAQNRQGRVRFNAAATAPNGTPHTYRAVAVRYRGATRAATQRVRTDVWAPRFREEFGGSRLNLDRWYYRSVGSYAPGRTVSASRPRAVEVRDGTARLMVMRDGFRNGKHYYANGHIGSHHSLRYGVMAARIRFPRGQGQHGAIWSLPKSTSFTAGPPRTHGAEIDVAEYFGDGFRGGGLGSYLHFRGADGRRVKLGDIIPNQQRFLAGRTDDWWKSYHVFSVEWTPQMYIFRIDGKETWRVRRGVSGTDQFLVLSLLTSDWELPRLDRSTLPTRMHVDWVRTWQRS